MVRALQLVAGLSLAAVLLGCSGNDGSEPDEPAAATTSSGAVESSEPPEAVEVSADSGAARIAAAVDVSTVPINEDNDPNDLLGQPNGYVAAIVIKDARVADCGDGLGWTAERPWRNGRMPMRPRQGPTTSRRSRRSRRFLAASTTTSMGPSWSACPESEAKPG